MNTWESVIESSIVCAPSAKLSDQRCRKGMSSATTEPICFDSDKFPAMRPSRYAPSCSRKTPQCRFSIGARSPGKHRSG